MKTIESRFFEHTQEEPTVFGEHDSALIRYLDLFSSIIAESFYVWDIPQKQFCYVRPDDFFLCGYSVEDTLREGLGFYSKIVYSKDLPLWTDMCKAIWRYLKDSEKKRDKVDYFSCTFRLQRKYSFTSHHLPQMVYHRIKPVWEDDELRYFICFVRGSSIKDTGNLRVYNSDGSAYKEYNFAIKRWKEKNRESLTERERAILMLAGQGKTTKEIANALCKGQDTIHNQIKLLFSKLNVHSMQEAIEYACYHWLIYPKQEDIELQLIKTYSPKKRILFTEDILQRIQQHLDDGKSIRQAARLEGVSESSVRYWRNKERCKK
jgi:DNA-binding CsgD family transcriptional regulator